MERIIAEALGALNAYPELCERLGIGNLSEFDSGSLFENDPDILRCDGENVLFVDLNVDEKRFILTSHDLDWNEYAMLEQWAQEGFSDHYTIHSDNSWSGFDRLENGIAYRGGCGYLYTIHQYCA